ncbi:MAG: Sec-independent protein translocase protein TatB [Woeseia sp.]
MSGVGLSELIILFVIGLIVLGPERLPRVANQLGKWIGQARRMTRVMKRQLEDELDFNKEFSIDPPARTRHSTPGAYKPPPPPAPEEHDETYSPMHDADSIGTGVGSDDAQAEENTEARPDDNGKDRKDPA